MQTALSTVEKMLRNLADNPTDPKPRRVRMANPNFKSKVVDVEGAVQLFEAAGFAIVSETPEGGGAEELFLVHSMEDYPQGQLRYTLWRVAELL